jgi:hypothetical protein
MLLGGCLFLACAHYSRHQPSELRDVQHLIYYRHLLLPLLPLLLTSAPVHPSLSLGTRARRPILPLHNIVLRDSRVVVCNDGGFVPTPVFEGFEDENAGCGV